ncbi:YfbM family protein [Actinomadura adrarensis]|uniref:YfbM family protein n=1 Tax=Actinomadura adrarensis TaxID=1819600 RepID=A0ABW3C947_9ACTN
MLGVHFAITGDQERLLLNADDETLGDLLEDIEENWPYHDPKLDTDKAWDAIHRCLGDGTLSPDGPAYPLSHAVLGGRHMHDEIYVVHVTATEVQDVAEALQPITKTWIRTRYNAIDDPDYSPHNEKDFEYTWANFTDMQAFYERAAKAQRAVIFTAT